MFAFAERSNIVPEGVNPARRIEKFKERRRERFLTLEELERLGGAIREAETSGIPWMIDESKSNTKHLPIPKKRFTKINKFAAAALRLLLFTGCRLREILNLQWEHVDLERGLLFLPDSKSGRKTVILNASAIAVLNQLEKIGPYVVPGDDPGRPRSDLHRPWRAITRRSLLQGVRLHDLRHTYASFGAGSGLGLPIIGRLLGHTQAATTARYAHLDNDPLRRASELMCGATRDVRYGPKADILRRGTFNHRRWRCAPRTAQIRAEPQANTKSGGANASTMLSSATARATGLKRIRSMDSLSRLAEGSENQSSRGMSCQA
jgi:integrase